MYKRFTDRARRVMMLANLEAQRFNHEYIGTEHILLGVVNEGSGVGGAVLKRLGVDLLRVRFEVERIVAAGPDMITMGRLPHTPRAKKVIEYAIEEARNLNHNCVGTEHLLLGLLLEVEGVAAHVLLIMGVRVDSVRAAIDKQTELTPATQEWVMRMLEKDPSEQDWMNRLLGRRAEGDRRWWQFWR